MFLRFVLAFILAVLMFYQLAEFPPIWLGIASVCLAILLAVSLRFSPILLWLAIQPKPQQRLFYRPVNIIFGLIIGFSWVFWHSFFSPTLPENILNQPVILTGTIIDLPNQSVTENRARIKYIIKVDSIHLDVTSEADKNMTYYLSGFKPKVVINWYLPLAQLNRLKELPKAGEIWKMRVKLKANHASMNPQVFDYETWLFQQGVSAKGYVKSYSSKQLSPRKAASKQYSFYKPVVQKVSEAAIFSSHLWRSNLAERMSSVFDLSPFKPFYQALTFGDKSAVTSDDWLLLQNTGTIHLMAISGLHMGIVALLGYWLFKALWWLGLYRVESINLPTLSAMGALIFATIYLMLSGFSIPTQRAWLMVVAVLIFVLIRRTFQPWSALALAALLITIWDPRSLLSFGFWLSFIAVALIFAALRNRDKESEIESEAETQILWQRWRTKFGLVIWIQFILTLGLAPLLIYLFNSLPSYSFIANLIAVPFVSLIGLPLLFVSSVLGLISVELGQWAISGLDWLWFYFWQYLNWINQLDHNRLSLSGLSLSWLLLWYALIFIGLKQSSYLKKAAIILGATLFFFTFVLQNAPQSLSPNHAKLTVLDVGQGQALVVETQSHLLVYDTGAKWGLDMDGAKLAVIPYLQSQGWSKIDQLIVSHSDSDHAGGANRLITSLKVGKAISGQPAILNQQLRKTNYRKSDLSQTANSQLRFSLCRAGQRWHYDGVEFEILSPNLRDIGKKLKSDNDLSCVLKISTGKHSVLITGDLSAKGELLLIENLAEKQTVPARGIKAWGMSATDGKSSELQADLLIAGHHGSNSSTSTEWLQVIQPKQIAFSAGYLNRFNFPSTKVLKRIQQYDSSLIKTGNTAKADRTEWWNTACSGALTFQLSPNGIKLQQENRKHRRKWYHHRCLEYQQGHLFQ